MYWGLFSALSLPSLSSIIWTARFPITHHGQAEVIELKLPNAKAIYESRKTVNNSSTTQRQQTTI